LDHGGNLTIWDTATWTEAWYVPHTGELGGRWAVTFSPDGSLLVLVGNEGITLWDAKSHQPITSFVGNLDGMYDVAFSQVLSSTLHMAIFAYGASARETCQNRSDFSNIGVISRHLRSRHGSLNSPKNAQRCNR
jgi:WD40 repeat protein